MGHLHRHPGRVAALLVGARPGLGHVLDSQDGVGDRDAVANESGAGVTRVGLDHPIPIANAILTVENEAQAWARTEEKGRDAARVAVEMANLLEDLT